VVHCKLYTTKTPITAANLLNDKVLPFYKAHDLPMLRILTDRGTEYCGKVEHHDYQLYLAINDIDHILMVSVSGFIKPSYKNFIKLPLGKTL